MINPFTIRTNQQSLNFLLEHKLATPFQQKWLSTLACYDYIIEYKKGVENKVVDAILRIPSATLLQVDFSSIHSTMWEDIQAQWETDPNLKQLIANLGRDPSFH